MLLATLVTASEPQQEQAVGSGRVSLAVRTGSGGKEDSRPHEVSAGSLPVW